MNRIDARQRIRTARRSGAEDGISLRKRRQWFADPAEEGDPSDGTQNTEDKAQSIPYDRFKSVNDAKKALEKKLADIEAANQAAATEAAKKRGDFEEVIKNLEPKAQRADTLEKTLKEYLDAEIADIPESMRGLVPQGDVTMQLGWIKQAKAANLFDKPKAPNLDGGNQGDKKAPNPVKLSDLEKEMAKLAGMSEADYAKYKSMKGEAPDLSKGKSS